jgi:hypothetical protein
MLKKAQEEKEALAQEMENRIKGVRKQMEDLQK